MALGLPGQAAIALTCDALDHAPIPEPFKILGIMRQQAGDAVDQHRGDNIGVVNLLAADCVACQQLEQLPGDFGGVIGDVELFQEPICLRQDCFFG